METLVQEKILSSFVYEMQEEYPTKLPININNVMTNVTRMAALNTMTTNDGNYFIRYGGFQNIGYYNAIEVYSVNSLDNNKAVYIFDNIKIDNHSVYINKLKQSEDGRFYGIGRYYDGTNFYSYLIIFNNFIQDGYCQVNKFYSNSSIGMSDAFFYDVAKVEDTGIYFIETGNKIIKFEINILEGNKTSIASIVDNGEITTGGYHPQLNVYKDKLIYTRLWDNEEEYEYEYTKAVINVNEDFPTTVTLNQMYYLKVDSDKYVLGATNKPYEAIIPYLSINSYSSEKNIFFNKIDINGNLTSYGDYSRAFNSNENLYAYMEEYYASVTDNSNLILYYVNFEGPEDERLIEFYSGSFTGYYTNTQLLKQNNIGTLIGTVSRGTQQKIVLIKNIYIFNVTSLPYYNYKFCLPYYLNLYSNNTDNTSLIFSRNATARFYSGNQITSTFIVPNYLLNDGNIEKANVYGQTNYLLNSKVEDYEKNRFESLYFNFIYNLNVIDNTNGLNTLNQIGSNRIANTLWNSFDNNDSRLSKARITYEDLSTEIINLNIPTVTGNSVTFNFEVTGNITKIEYLSNDESIVYATFRTNLTGTNTITQTIRVE